jgi:hypothetical protein
MCRIREWCDAPLLSIGHAAGDSRAARCVVPPCAVTPRKPPANLLGLPARPRSRHRPGPSSPTHAAIRVADAVPQHSKKRQHLVTDRENWWWRGRVPFDQHANWFAIYQACQQVNRNLAGCSATVPSMGLHAAGDAGTGACPVRQARRWSFSGAVTRNGRIWKRGTACCSACRTRSSATMTATSATGSLAMTARSRASITPRRSPTRDGPVAGITEPGEGAARPPSALRWLARHNDHGNPEWADNVLRPGDIDL